MALFGAVFAVGAGSALAQVTVEVPDTVNEAGVLTVSLTADIRVSGTYTTAEDIPVTVVVGVGTADLPKGITVGEAADYRPPAAANTAALDWTIKVNNDPDDDAQDREGLKEKVDIQILPDLDAEDEAITVTVTLGTVPSGITAKGSDSTNLALTTASVGEHKVTIKDAQTQAFDWDLTTDTSKEGTPIKVDLKARYEPVQLLHSMPLSLADALGYTLDITTATIGASRDNDGAITGTVVRREGAVSQRVRIPPGNCRSSR